MTRVPDSDTVFVETAARLHFGLLDLRGDLGRKFGGIGAAAPAPTLVVSVERADSVEASGPDADRAAEFARRFLDYHAAAGSIGARICVQRALPSHAGLGSGTQLALAVARAVAELYGFPADMPDLARAVGRAQRSAIGTWTFAGGGLVVEGGRPFDAAQGRRETNDAVAPLLTRLPFPPSWRCVVAVPNVSPALNGAAEAAAFAALPPAQDDEVARVARLVLMALLPALVDGDLRTFGDALTAVQTINGRWFAAVQGGTFSPGASAELVRRMSEWGASGVGQSSWGPAVYGIVDGDDAGARLVERVRGALDALAVAGSVYCGPFRTAGAHIWKA
jgi:beta-ribofuranosylaminobenzene 5'-phosphate synthase